MTESFQALRPLLFAIAYRMLGSAAEAEDVLQDAWLRFRGVRLPPKPEQTFEIVDVNGWPAFVARTSGVASAVMSIETDGARILAIRNVVNPEKLARV